MGLILEVTKGYAYFLQEWGSHTWLAAKQSSILPEVVRQASVTAIAALDEGFFPFQFSATILRDRRRFEAAAFSVARRLLACWMSRSARVVTTSRFRPSASA